MMQRRSAESDVTLSYARQTLLAARDEGQWATIDVTLKRLVPALALDRFDVAAIALGGIATIESALFDDDVTQLESAEITLRAELGPELERVLQSGRSMTKTEIVTVVLAETENVLRINAARTTNALFGSPPPASEQPGATH